MGQVKGSEQVPLVLKPHRPLRQFLGWTASLVFVLVLIAAAYAHGMRVAVSERQQMLQDRANLEDQIQHKSSQVLDLTQKVAVHKHGTEVTRKATEEVRQENKRLRDRIGDLEESVAFYKGVMDPSRNVRGLKIDSFELLSTGDVKRFRYKFVLTQVADNSRYVEGSVRFDLVGTLNGTKKTLALAQISLLEESAGEKFRFKYFQDFSGELTLPEDFIPEQVIIVAQSKGRGAVRLEEMFDWPKQENKEHVRQG